MALGRAELHVCRYNFDDNHSKEISANRGSNLYTVFGTDAIKQTRLITNVVKTFPIVGNFDLKKKQWNLLRARDAYGNDAEMKHRPQCKEEDLFVFVLFFWYFPFLFSFSVRIEVVR